MAKSIGGFWSSPPLTNRCNIDFMANNLIKWWSACHLIVLKTYYHVITKLTSSYNINAINREFQDNISIQFCTNARKMLSALILSQYLWLSATEIKHSTTQAISKKAGWHEKVTYHWGLSLAPADYWFSYLHLYWSSPSYNLLLLVLPSV